MNVPQHLKSILIAAFMASACVIAAIAMQNVHLALAEPTVQQDRAELARLETQAHIGDAQPDAPSLSAASNWPTDRTSAQPKEQLQFKPNQSKPFTSRVPAARTNLALELKSSRRYQEASSRTSPSERTVARFQPAKVRTTGIGFVLQFHCPRSWFFKSMRGAATLSLMGKSLVLAIRRAIRRFWEMLMRPVATRRCVPSRTIFDPSRILHFSKSTRRPLRYG
jgi:hypothetical protein